MKLGVLADCFGLPLHEGIQTAARLGMTQVQVSRREKKILTALRRELTG